MVGDREVPKRGCGGPHPAAGSDVTSGVKSRVAVHERFLGTSSDENVVDDVTVTSALRDRSSDGVRGAREPAAAGTWPSGRLPVTSCRVQVTKCERAPRRARAAPLLEANGGDRSLHQTCSALRMQFRHI